MADSITAHAAIAIFAHAAFAIIAMPANWMIATRLARPDVRADRSEAQFPELALPSDRDFLGRSLRGDCRIPSGGDNRRLV